MDDNDNAAPTDGGAADPKDSYSRWTVPLGPGGELEIPAHLLDKYGVEEGDKVAVSRKSGKVYLTFPRKKSQSTTATRIAAGARIDDLDDIIELRSTAGQLQWGLIGGPPVYEVAALYRRASRPGRSDARVATKVAKELGISKKQVKAAVAVRLAWPDLTTPPSDRVGYACEGPVDITSGRWRLHIKKRGYVTVAVFDTLPDGTVAPTLLELDERLVEMVLDHLRDTPVEGSRPQTPGPARIEVDTHRIALFREGDPVESSLADELFADAVARTINAALHHLLDHYEANDPGPTYITTAEADSRITQTLLTEIMPTLVTGAGVPVAVLGPVRGTDRRTRQARGARHANG